MWLKTSAIQPYSNFMILLYQMFSEKRTFSKVDSPIFTPYVERLLDPNIHYYPTTCQPNDLQGDKRPKNNKVMVAFSGGKDSLAVAIKLMNEGKDVTLFFLQGINKSYTSEYQSAYNLAQKLGLPFVSWRVTQIGKSDFKENPFKNGVILCLMVEAGYEYEISEFAFGNQLEDNLSNCQYDREMSDSIEFFNMMKEYLNFVTINTYLKNDRDSFEIVYKYRPDLLEDIGSCILPVFRRPFVKKANQKRFNINTKYCGSCYKCAFEYLFKAEKGILPKNEAYETHCKKILEKNSINLF